MVLVHPLRNVRTSVYLLVLAFLNTCEMATPIPGIHIRKKRWLVPLVMILISKKLKSFQQMSVSSVQSLSLVWLFKSPWITARQASLSITNSRSSPKPVSIELVMPSNHLILCHSSSLPALNLSQHQSLFKWVSSSHQVARVLGFQL